MSGSEDRTAVCQARGGQPRALRMLLLLVLLLPPAVLSAQRCEPPPGPAGAVRALSGRLLGLAGDPARDPDPATYLGLRLGREHNLQLEQHYLERLHRAFQHPYGRSVQAHGYPEQDAELSTGAERPQTGRLALYLLGLRATCPPTKPHRALVTWLKYYLEEDWTGSRRHGHPLTNYYQYGLGVLALCAHHKRVREEVIRRLLEAQHRGRLGHSAVDTEAVLALAFACLERRRLVGAGLAAELRDTVHRVSRSMAQAQGPEGIIGNIYSTPWALQVFLATGMCHTEPAYSRAVAALLENLDAFGTATTMAQVLPVLHGHSYLDVATMHCQEELDTLTPLDMEPPAEVPGNKTVRLVVECAQPWCSELQLYDRRVSTPTAASLLDVLGAATAQEPHFTFDTQDTPQGPYLTQVLGLEARQEKRNYWQLLTAPSTPLLTGVADYIPHDGETLILRLSEW